MHHTNSLPQTFRSAALGFTLLVGFLFGTAAAAEAATLSVTPNTGVYTVGNTFTVRVVVNTGGKSVNAADGQLSFNPRELSVLSASRSSSIFSLWTEEPSFSNSAGTVSFGGGSPAGYTGSAGTIVSVTFKALAAGTPKITFKSGSILAADGMGTNILTSMAGGTYTVGAQAETPEPEQIEYIAPANTPKAPVLESESHPDQTLWYTEKTAKLSWNLPNDVTSIRTLLDSAPATIPTIVYDERFTTKTLEDLDEGESYFHIQFKNDGGWGKVAHYRLAVDTKPPEAFTVTEDVADPTNPVRTLTMSYTDVSPVVNYSIQIDGGEPIQHTDEKGEKRYTLPSLLPGHHTVVVEARDSAGNTSVASYSFDIASFEPPVFTEYPERLSTGVIPALRGTTRPNAEVTVTMRHGDGSTESGVVMSDESGTFTFIPESPFTLGVHDVTAVARDEHGATSEASQPIRIVAEDPGYIRVGTFVVKVLSVIIPLIALLLLTVFGTWYLWHKLGVWKRKVKRETVEAEERLKLEIDEAINNINERVNELRESRKGKLTKAEVALIEQMEAELADVRQKVRKEIVDIEDVVQ